MAPRKTTSGLLVPGFPCGSCSRIFTTRQVLVSHRITHLPLAFKCHAEGCRHRTEGYRTEKYLLKHLKEDHARSTLTATWSVCEVEGCNEQFSEFQVADLQRHMETHDDTVSRKKEKGTHQLLEDDLEDEQVTRTMTPAATESRISHRFDSPVGNIHGTSALIGNPTNFTSNGSDQAMIPSNEEQAPTVSLTCNTPSAALVQNAQSQNPEATSGVPNDIQQSNSLGSIEALLAQPYLCYSCGKTYRYQKEYAGHKCAQKARTTLTCLRQDCPWYLRQFYDGHLLHLHNLQAHPPSVSTSVGEVTHVLDEVQPTSNREVIVPPALQPLEMDQRTPFTLNAGNDSEQALIAPTLTENEFAPGLIEREEFTRQIEMDREMLAVYQHKRHLTLYDDSLGGLPKAVSKDGRVVREFGDWVIEID